MTDRLRVLDPSNAPQKALQTLQEAMEEGGDELSEVMVIGYVRGEGRSYTLRRWSSQPDPFTALGMLQTAMLELWEEQRESSE